MGFVDDILERVPLAKKYPAIALVVVFGLWLFIDLFQTWYKLRNFPGPFLAKFSNFWQISQILSGRMDKRFRNVTREYGPLVRIGPNQLITSDPDLTRRMYSTKSNYKRSDWYVGMRFDPAHDNCLSLLDDDAHAAMRAKLYGGYSGRDIDNLEQIIDECVHSYVKLCEKYVSTDTDFRPMDMGVKTQYFTLDVISYLAHGKPFNYLYHDSDALGYMEDTRNNLPGAMMVTIWPWMNKLLQTSFVKKYMPSEKDPTGFGRILGITKEIVGKRFGEEKIVQRDMLGSFVRNGLTQREAEAETVLQIVAGSDTTATAIRTVFYHCISNPRVLDKMRREWTEAGISSPVKDSEARKLPYLQAVIKEGLRIWPPVIGTMAKEVPPEGDTFKGQFIPGGTSIGQNAYGIYRSKEIWGDTAEIFFPERWIDNPPEKIKEYEQISELVFSYGKWACLGKTVAFMELNKVFIELFRRFDFALCTPGKPLNIACFGVFFIQGMDVTVTRRDDY